MDNVYAHYLRNNTPLAAENADRSWVMFQDRAIFIFNYMNNEYDFFGYANPPRIRPDAMRLYLLKGKLP